MALELGSDSLTLHEGRNGGSGSRVPINMKRTLWLVPALAAISLVGCAAQAGYYVAAPPPPAPVVRVVGYAPGPGYAWVEGFWDWRGRYVWVPGYWARPPRPHAVWVPGRAYYNHGRYYRRRGHWR